MEGETESREKDLRGEREEEEEQNFDEYDLLLHKYPQDQRPRNQILQPRSGNCPMPVNRYNY